MNKKNSQENRDQLQDLLEKAQFYILNQKYSEAIKILRKLIEVEDASPHTFYLYGLACEGTNDLEEAKKAFRRVLELSPDHNEAHQHLDRLIDG
ncbi:tetratricopeptide repeat protein [candidate division WOR-3 bacterium]|nr:tetratricopeptide repeat protein [candidate division WOR-3 bacterium]